MMMDRQLYLPEKYCVLLGSGNCGFCTVWSDPEQTISRVPEILKKAAIVGTLRSREGVNVILRNLALNPDIDRLYIWGKESLSQTPFGLAGLEILKNLWEKGVGEDGQVNGTSFRLHKEFDRKVLEFVLKKVELIDLSAMNLDEAVAKTVVGKGKRYMIPKSFPEHRLEAGQPMPSEVVGFLVRDKTITNTWLKVVDRIMRYGVIKETEYGSKQRELIGLSWVIETESTKNALFPDWPDEVLKLTGATKIAIEKYYPEFMTAELPSGVEYTYGQRLWDFQGKVNQVGQIIERLKESAVTRRAVGVTWNQFKDGDKLTKNPPCFVLLQAIQTEGKLNLLAVFRSHDIFKAAIPNAFGLRRLHEYLAKEAGFDLGCLSITSNSAHIYEEDWEQAKKLLQCSLWDRPVSLDFDPSEEADPRATVLVRVECGRIVAEIAAPGGDSLLLIDGECSKEVYRKIAKLDLLSRPNHYADLGAELQKAEIARDLGLNYVQDKRLPIEKSNSACKT